MLDLLQAIFTEIRGSWRFRWQAMLAAWLVCILGWIAVYTMPDIYEARAQVFVDAESRLATVMSEVGVSPELTSRVYLVQQAMLGRPQLERVASETDLDLRARDTKEKEELLLGLRENIVISYGRSREAKNLYTISYRDRDRNMAISVVQTLLDTFVEDVLKLKDAGSDDVTGYLAEQRDHYSTLLSESELKLANFKKEYVGLLPGESGGVFERLQQEMDLLDERQLELRIEMGRRDELRRQLQAENPYLPEGAETGISVAGPDNSMEATIKELESRKRQLLLAFTGKHPDVIALDEQLVQLYKQREDSRAAALQSGLGMEGVSNATNPVYQSGQIALNESSVRIAGLRSQVSEHEREIGRLNNQINTIPLVEAEYAKLTRDYRQYTDLYNEITVKIERERMGGAGNQRDIVSFKIIDPPAAELEPVAPRRSLLLVAVLILALGAGGAAAYLMHQLNPVFHDPSVLRQVTGRPVLGIIGMTWVERHARQRRADVTTFCLVTACLIVAFGCALAFQDEAVQLMYSLHLKIRS